MCGERLLSRFAGHVVLFVSPFVEIVYSWYSCSSCTTSCLFSCAVLVVLVVLFDLLGGVIIFCHMLDVAMIGPCT